MDIYVIIESLGCWEDYRERILYACGTEGKAKQIIKDLEENGPKLPFSDLSPEESTKKMSEFQRNFLEFDNLIDEEYKEGGRYWHNQWSMDSKEFIKADDRTLEQKREYKRWSDWCEEDSNKKLKEFMLNAMPDVTEKMIDDWHYLNYYMSNPIYNYKKIPYVL